MLQKLEYLKKYTMRKNGYVRLIPFDEIPKINSLPNTWYEIFKEKDKKRKLIHFLRFGISICLPNSAIPYLISGSIQ